MTKSVTSKDIAEHFGLSLATVSRALNDSDDISPETRRMVLAYAQEVGFISQRSTSLKGTLGILWGKRMQEGTALASIAALFSDVAVKSRYKVKNFDIGNDFDAATFFDEQKLCGALILGVGYGSPHTGQKKGLTAATSSVGSA